MPQPDGPTSPESHNESPVQPTPEQSPRPSWFEGLVKQGKALKEEVQQRFEIPRFDRRDFFRLAFSKVVDAVSFATAIKLVLLSKERLIDPVESQLGTYDEAELLSLAGDEEAFLKSKHDEVANSRAATSFRPQAYDLHLKDIYELERLQRIDKRSPQEEHAFQEITRKKTRMEKSFAIMVEQFGFTDVRLGIEWEDTVDAQGNVDLRYYQPLLDYCQKNGVKLCMNIGIKTFGYPEVKIPDSVLKQAGNPPDGAEITADSGIGEMALSFTQAVAQKLQPYAGAISTVQADNEWDNRFGKHQWHITSAYEIEAIKVLADAFPRSAILVNFPGTPTDPLRFWESGGKHAAELRQLARADIQGRFIGGDNYYHMVPGYPVLPVGGSTERSMLDADTMREALGGVATKEFFAPGRREVSEAQLQKWNQYTAPGSSLKECLFMLSRCFQILDAKKAIDGGGEYAIRVWGIEDFLQKFLDGTLSHEQKIILRLLGRMNGRKKEAMNASLGIS